MFKKWLFAFLLIPALVFADQFVEGKDYTVVPNPTPVSVRNTGPVVTEFFSYGCPWCYKMEAPLSQWKTTDGKTFAVDKVPVVFKPTWDLYAKAFYVAKTLAMTGKVNPALFKAIQEDNKPMDTKQAMIDFFVAQGVDREIAKSAFESSPTIDTQVSNGMALMAQYQINAVPCFVVNGKYKTDLQMAGSQERLFEILNYLIKKS